jgi:hypothetical protein
VGFLTIDILKVGKEAGFEMIGNFMAECRPIIPVL